MYPRQTRNTVEMEPHEQRSGPSMNLNANAGEALAIAATRMGYQARAVTPGHRATQSPEPFPSGPDVVRASQLTPTSPSPAPALQERWFSPQYPGTARRVSAREGGTNAHEFPNSRRQRTMNQEKASMAPLQNTCAGTNGAVDEEQRNPRARGQNESATSQKTGRGSVPGAMKLWSTVRIAFQTLVLAGSAALMTGVGTAQAQSGTTEENNLVDHDGGREWTHR